VKDERKYVVLKYTLETKQREDEQREDEQREELEQEGEPAYYTFPVAASRMPSFSDSDLKSLDLDWRYRTAKLFSEAASEPSPPEPEDAEDR
jgi:hypothetical protein